MDDGEPARVGRANVGAVTTDQPLRFISLARACQTLGISSSQGYTLVKSGEIPAIQIGGRGIWRIEVGELEAYIQRRYAATRIKAAQLGGAGDINGG